MPSFRPGLLSCKSHRRAHSHRLRPKPQLTSALFPNAILMLLRRLAAYPRQNALARALREIGCLERTLFILDWISDPALRRRSNAGLRTHSSGPTALSVRLGSNDSGTPSPLKQLESAPKATTSCGSIPHFEFPKVLRRHLRRSFRRILSGPPALLTSAFAEPFSHNGKNTEDRLAE